MRDLTKSYMPGEWWDDWTEETLEILAGALKSMRGITTGSMKILGETYYTVRIGEYVPFDLQGAEKWCEQQFGPANDSVFPYTWWLGSNNTFGFNTEDKRIAFLLRWNNAKA